VSISSAPKVLAGLSMGEVEVVGPHTWPAHAWRSPVVSHRSQGPGPVATPHLRDVSGTSRFLPPAAAERENRIRTPRRACHARQSPPNSNVEGSGGRETAL
jgi:hypothetical protein